MNETSFKKKVDNRFKQRFLNTIAEKLKTELPKLNLKAQPHVHSRLRHFKGIYNVVIYMVVGSCTSGFGCDPETKLVVAEKEVWKAYVKVRSFNLIFFIFCLCLFAWNFSFSSSDLESLSFSGSGIMVLQG